MADMTDFSTKDRLIAICSPLSCCLPTCRLAPSPSTDSLLDQEADIGGSSSASRTWYSQSRPLTSGRAAEPGVPGDWEDPNERRARREADLMSLHEGLGSAPRRLRRGRGGDISGSGATEGSGLSRWTLLRSWWTGKGVVRLPDSDDEDEGREWEGNEQGAYQDHRPDLDLHAEPGDGDAVPLSSPTPFAPSEATSDSLRGDDDNDDNNESLDREERRARRRARRRAKELGLSVEEFASGATAEPDELLASPLLDIPSATAGPSSRRSGRKGGSAGSGSTAQSSSENRSSPLSPTFVVVDQSSTKELPNGSHGFDFSHPISAEDEEGMDGGEELFGRKKSSRRKKGEEAGSSSRGSGSGSTHSRSTGTRSRIAKSSATSGDVGLIDTSKRHLLPSQVPLPASPISPMNIGTSTRGHRSHPSTSTTSTTSSGGRRKKSKKPRSPLQGHPEFEDNETTPTQYYQDENGQLRQRQQYAEDGQWYADEHGQPYFVPYQAAPVNQYYAPAPLDFSQAPLQPASYPSDSGNSLLPPLGYPETYSESQ